MWCIAWWHSGRDDEDEDEEIAGPESSRTGAGYEETLTPLSAETPLPSTVSRCPSPNAIQTMGIVLDSRVGMQHEYKGPTRPVDLTKTISSDSVRTTTCLFDRTFLPSCRERGVFRILRKKKSESAIFFSLIKKIIIITVYY